jgi:hypothetical protein
MAVGLGGGGFLGLAIEAVSGTYLAPTKFVPIRTESLRHAQDTQWRRPIRQSVDNLGGVPGNTRCEGEVAPEATPDVVPYFHLASRATCVKTGAAAPFTYTFTPNPNAVATKTLSITIVRNGVAFGYKGCTVGSFTYSIDNGQLVATYNIIGRDEADQTVPVASWTTNINPYGAGEYGFELPSATTVTDVSAFSFSVDDAAEAQYRFKGGGDRGAEFVKFGERSVTASLTRDFHNRTDYDAYKALTGQSFKVTASRSANDEITITAPSFIKNSYELGLSSQGDLIVATINYEATYDQTTGRAYQLVVKTSEDITIT